MRYSTCRTACSRSARSAGGGIANRAPAALIRCLPRLIRCAMVDSGTRKAAAICAVVNPPTARRVSATCDGADSAGWQHRNSSFRVSSAGSPSSPAPPDGDGLQPGDRVVRDALLGPLHGGGQHGVLDRVLAGIEPAVPPNQGTE